MVKNSKAHAWDLISSLYWNAGYDGGPSRRGVEAYLLGVHPGKHVLIIGASTRNLIAGCLERNLRLSVLDFSARMLEALKGELRFGAGVELYHCDMTEDLPADLENKFDYILADRLFNRFTEEELVLALRNVVYLLRDDGRMRTSIRLGLYPRDLPILAEGRRRGVLEEFFDQRRWTIDYSKTGDILDLHLNPHGSIPRDVLLEFYRYRGIEKRLIASDIARYVENTSCHRRRLGIASIKPFPDADNCMLYSLQVVPYVRGGQI